jgi:hypothetical protein
MSGGDMGANVLWSALLGDLDLTGKSGTIEIDAESGSFTLGGTMLVPEMPAGFAKVQQANGPVVAVFGFRKLIVPAGVTLLPSSRSKERALVLAATVQLQIAGTIDWSGFGASGGDRLQPGQSGPSNVVSGGQPGLGNSSGSGGGGAGHADIGGTGMGTSAGMGGASYGTPTIVPLHVGSGGGGGGGLFPGGAGGAGGAGGGAVALLSRGEVTVSGVVDVSGIDGRPGGGASTASAGGGGGGSGGSLLISAPSVVLADRHNLLAKGGGIGVGVMGGGDGGKGSIGRIWVGATTVSIAGGAARSTPTAVIAQGTVVDTFPR